MGELSKPLMNKKINNYLFSYYSFNVFFLNLSRNPCVFIFIVETGFLNRRIKPDETGHLGKAQPNNESRCKAVRSSQLGMKERDDMASGSSAEEVDEQIVIKNK